MFSRFFIDRPIFAAVLSVFIVIAGLAAMRALPIAQYPEIAPPVVTVTAIYPGASAEVIEQTVAAPIENAINGVERMIYMNSTSTSNGVVQIQVTFDIGTNVDQAALNVNNRVKQAEANVIRSYLEWIAELPWSKRAEAKDDLDAVTAKLAPEVSATFKVNVVADAKSAS